MKARFKEALDTFRRSARRINADRSIPEKIKKAFLDVNGFLAAEVKRYAKAERILGRPCRQPGDLLARADAKKQIRKIEAFGRILKAIMDRNEANRISNGEEAIK